MAAPMPEPAYVRAADLVILFYIYGSNMLYARWPSIVNSRFIQCNMYTTI